MTSGNALISEQDSRNRCLGLRLFIWFCQVKSECLYSNFRLQIKSAISWVHGVRWAIFSNQLVIHIPKWFSPCGVHIDLTSFVDFPMRLFMLRSFIFSCIAYPTVNFITIYFPNSINQIPFLYFSCPHISIILILFFVRSLINTVKRNCSISETSTSNRIL